MTLNHDKLMEEKIIKPSFEFWVIFENHKIEENMIGIGIINGLHYDVLDKIYDELEDSVFGQFDVKKEFPDNCTVGFIASNVVYEDGQMSFPETGQWDFPPRFEFDINVSFIDIHPINSDLEQKINV